MISQHHEENLNIFFMSRGLLPSSSAGLLGGFVKHTFIMILFLLSPPTRDKTHADWVKAYLSIFTELQGYIKAHHTTGLTWSKTVSLSPHPPTPASPSVKASVQVPIPPQPLPPASH